MDLDDPCGVAARRPMEPVDVLGDQRVEVARAFEVDERLVPAGATQFAGRAIASGVVPSGARGAVVVQGTSDGGLTLTAR